MAPSAWALKGVRQRLALGGPGGRIPRGRRFCYRGDLPAGPLPLDVRGRCLVLSQNTRRCEASASRYGRNRTVLHDRTAGNLASSYWRISQQRTLILASLQGLQTPCTLLKAFVSLFLACTWSLKCCTGRVAMAVRSSAGSRRLSGRLSEDAERPVEVLREKQPPSDMQQSLSE